MVYLSKGIREMGMPGHQPTAFHGNQRIQLTRVEAMLWQKGRFAFATLGQPDEYQALAGLEQLGLVEAEKEDSAVARYRILTRCILCPAETSGIPVWGEEKILLTWLRYAGLRLTVAELVCLEEQQVEPAPGLLYEANRQALVERIYTRENIRDCLLECQMEDASSRDKVVQGLLGLLWKRKILLM